MEYESKWLHHTFACRELESDILRLFSWTMHGTKGGFNNCICCCYSTPTVYAKSWAKRWFSQPCNAFYRIRVHLHRWDGYEELSASPWNKLQSFAVVVLLLLRSIDSTSTVKYYEWLPSRLCMWLLNGHLVPYCLERVTVEIWWVSSLYRHCRVFRFTCSHSVDYSCLWQRRSNTDFSTKHVLQNHTYFLL